MDWCCPQDQAQLLKSADKLVCPRCGYGVTCLDRAVCLPSALRSSPNPLTVELHELIKRTGFRTACDSFCEDHAASIDPRSSDWRFLLPIRKESILLEVGAGCGFDTVALAACAATVIGLVPDADTGSILAANLQTNDVTNSVIAATQDLTRLPLASASVDLICAEDAGLAGFGIDAQTFPAVVAEFRRVLSPRGTVFLGVTNTFGGLPILRRLAGKMRVRSQSRSLNRLIKPSASDTHMEGVGRHFITRRMRRAGFHGPRLYCPYPDEEKASAVLSNQNQLAAGYFFRRLLRRNSIKARLALYGAGCLASLNMSHLFSPYFYMFFDIEAPDSDSRSTG